MEDNPGGPPSLCDLMPPEAMRFNVAADDWRAAIREAGILMTATGATTPDYTQQMVDAVDRFGPYIVIAPGFALAHAQASESVLHTGMSWVQLAHPVEFGNKANDPVTLVVGLASHSHEAHMSALQQLGTLLVDPATRDQLQSASTPEELTQLLK